MTVRIITADVMDGLAQLENESVNSVVTSPPYFGLRDYGTALWEGGDGDCDHKQGRNGSGRADGIVDERAQRNRDGVGSMGGDCRKCGATRIDKQIGLEPTPDAYVAKMVEVFREVRRVLRKDGTCWLNLGDSYSAGGRGCATAKQRSNAGTGIGVVRSAWSVPGFASKQLLGIPWRVAFALQADGWWLRQDIIWSKPNPMPESVTDRCTKAHEYLFLLTKSERYFFDAEAISEPVTQSTIDRLGQPTLSSQVGSDRVPGKTNGAMKARPPRFGGTKYGDNDSPEHRTKGGKEYDVGDGRRNKRSVWTVPTQPYSEAHFATFPPALIDPCIKAGCPKGGTVLDPFGGSGTTGMVADRLGRDSILIELNPEYAALAHRRIIEDAGMFVEMS